MTTPPEFKDFCSDDYQTFMGIEVDDNPRIAELHGFIDGEEVDFVVIVTASSMYVLTYIPDGEPINEYLYFTNAGESFAKLLNWDEMQIGHMESIGFEHINKFVE